MAYHKEAGPLSTGLKIQALQRPWLGFLCALLSLLEGEVPAIMLPSMAPPGPFHQALCPESVPEPSHLALR